MRNILLVYRGQVIVSEILDKINYYNGDVITLIVENEITKKIVKTFDIINKNSIIIHTVDELLEGELDEMKFDYIIGNPPYQYPKGFAKSKKLYIDITTICQNLLTELGYLHFITPKAIIKSGQSNSSFDKLKTGLIEVNYDANDNFNIGQTVISFIYCSNNNSEIKIIENKKERTVDSIEKVCREEENLLNSILHKVDYTKNNKTKMKITKADKRFGIPKSLLSLKKTKVYSKEIVCNTKKQRIKFSKENEGLVGYLQIVIPYSGGWNEGCFINNKSTNHFWFVNDQEETTETLKNMKIYIESKFITYCIINYSSKVKPTTGYNFLFRLTEVDFTKSWTDKELYQEFDLTEEEINEVENWCKENSDKLPNKNNPLNEY